MSAMIVELDGILGRIELLAEQLRADPDGHVHRSARELRAAFGDRQAIEPGVARVRESLRMLRRDNREGSRREFQRRARTLDELEAAVEHDLLPRLRQSGFEV